MTVALVVAVAAAAVSSTLLVLARVRVMRRRRSCPVVLTLKSGEGFKGVLADEDARVLVLRNVEAIDAKPVAVDGEIIVPWSDVKYLQRL